MRRAFALGIVAALSMATSATIVAEPAAAAASSPQIAGALDLAPATVAGVEVIGDQAGVAVLAAPIAGFPTAPIQYLVISTGNAEAVVGNASTFVSTALPGAAKGADGNDLTQVKLSLRPPAGATCVGLDFAFLSEEYPEYVGTQFNDIFTAEIGGSQFSVQGGQVVAPQNFAYDSQGNPVSINTVFGMGPVPGTTMDGATPPLSAVGPVEVDPDTKIMDLYLSVQDLGDSGYDSAVFVDNVTWQFGTTCITGATPIADSDGDALPDSWETHGIDYDGDGVPELDLPAMGADPNHKDLFVEVDWMVKGKTCVWFICWGGKDFAPQRDALRDVVAAYAAAPVSNPDGTTGIRMHIDSGADSIMDPRTQATWGSRSRGGAIPHQDVLGSSSGNTYNWSALEAVKSARFDQARRDAFHYVVYADRFGSGDTQKSSGISRGIPGGDLVLADGHSSWGGGFTRTQERGTFMHELGHNMNLWHGGGPNGNLNNSVDYRSIMNYRYQLPGLPPNSGLDYSRGAPYDDWANLRFDGGSVGAFGDSAPVPAETTADSLDADTAKADNVFAEPGDGLVTIVGPTVLFSVSGTQLVHLDVSNQGPTAAPYIATLSSSTSALAGTASSTVSGGGTARLTIPVDTTGLPPGEHEITVVLTGLSGDPLFTATDLVTVPDPASSGYADDLRAALEQLDSLPAGAGLDPAVLEAVRANLAAALTPSVPPTTTLTPTTTESSTTTLAPSTSATTSTPTTSPPPPTSTTTDAETPLPTTQPSTVTPTTTKVVSKPHPTPTTSTPPGDEATTTVSPTETGDAPVPHPPSSAVVRPGHQYEPDAPSSTTTTTTTTTAPAEGEPQTADPDLRNEASAPIAAATSAESDAPTTLAARAPEHPDASPHGAFTQVRDVPSGWIDTGQGPQGGGERNPNSASLPLATTGRRRA
jgi:hypothetical protein